MVGKRGRDECLVPVRSPTPKVARLTTFSPFLFANQNSKFEIQKLEMQRPLRHKLTQTRHSTHSLLLLIFAVALVASGCKRSGPKPVQAHPLPSPPLVAKCEAGQFGGRLVLALPVGPRSFNPLVAIDSASDSIVRLLYGSLMSLDWTTQEAGPGLAESWSVAPDEKTWTFKLRQGLHWSDGRPLTADDVVFTWNDVMYNPEINRFTYEVFRIGGKSFEVSRVDDLTVRVVTPEVFAPFLEYFGGV